jgi:tetratricopeptide (TPR) repeat protein
MSDNLIEEGIEGESILTCAARVGQGIENSEGYSEIMALIAIRCARVGLLDTAVELSESIDDPYSREQALAGIAAECIEFEEDGLADELVEGIEDPGLHGAAMEQVAVKYAEAGKFDEALDVADRMDNSGQALGSIALLYADGGRFEDALEVARSIEEFGVRASILTELALRGHRSGSQPDEAQQLLAEARETAEEIDITQEKINALLEIASSYKEVGDSESAAEILSRVLSLCRRLESGPDVRDDYEKDSTLANIAARFATVQHFDMAEQVLEEIDDPYNFAAAQADIALEYHRAEQREKALTLLGDALEVARDENVYGEQTLALRERLFSVLATSYSTAGHSEEALQVAESISTPDLRFGTLREMAKTFVQEGKIDSATEAADLIEGAYAKVLYDLGLRDALAEASQEELAASILQRALADADMIELAYEKALALMEIAAGFARKGEAGTASELLFNALETVPLIKDSYQRARTLIILDGKYKDAGLSPGEREEKVQQEISPA